MMPLLRGIGGVNDGIHRAIAYTVLRIASRGKNSHFTCVLSSQSLTMVLMKYFNTWLLRKKLDAWRLPVRIM